MAYQSSSGNCEETFDITGDSRAWFSNKRPRYSLRNASTISSCSNSLEILSINFNSL